ncbi:MAG: hypothetical protein AB7N76_11710 [Planctomycetota bacterium]
MSGPRTMTLRVSTPREELAIDAVLRLRCEAPDGLRGVLPGHEPALVLLLPGVVRLARADERGERRSYLAHEGGFLRVRPDDAALTSAWVAHGEDLDDLVARLRRRRARRAEAEAAARLLAERHERAAREALARLQREVRS